MTILTVTNTPLILIADDDRFTRMMLRQLMEQEGYQVAEVENGEQCLNAYTKYKPDMVLLDAMMPVMDGFTCCTQLQTFTRDDPIPVLMITGLNDQASVDWAFEAGATDFVTKPIHPPVLRRRVRRFLEASWAERTLRKRERQYSSIVENIKQVIFQIDPAGNWTFLNPAWTKLTEFSVEESLGANVLNYVHPDDRQLHQELWRSLFEGHKVCFRHEMRYLTKTWQYRRVEVDAYVTSVNEGVVAEASGMLREITEHL